MKTCCTISTWRRTRAGLNGISTSFGALFSQSKIFSTSFPVTWKSSQFLIADSRRILIEYGSRSDRRNGQIHGSNHQYFQLTETYKPTKLYGKKNALNGYINIIVSDNSRIPTLIEIRDCGPVKRTHEFIHITRN